MRPLIAALIVAAISALAFPLVAQGHWKSPPPEAIAAQACLVAAPMVTLGAGFIITLRGKGQWVPRFTCGVVALIFVGGLMAFATAVIERR